MTRGVRTSREQSGSRQAEAQGVCSGSPSCWERRTFRLSGRLNHCGMVRSVWEMLPRDGRAVRPEPPPIRGGAVPLLLAPTVWTSAAAGATRCSPDPAQLALPGEHG